MSWITPKTDWTVLDYFNIEDYNRIKGNIEYLVEYAKNINLDLVLPFALENATIETVPKVSLFNSIVYDTDYIRNSLSQNIVGYRDMRTYTEKGSAWNYSDLIIIENNIFLLKQRMDGIFYAKDMLPFDLGKGEL